MPLAPPIRVALIGAGRIGSHHAAAIARDVHAASLAVIVDPRIDTATALAHGLGARAEADASGVLKDPDIDAIVVTTPAALHRDLIVEAAAAGKHVFTEKPITTDLVEADECVAAAQQAGVVLQVGFNRRFAPGFAAARAAVDNGAFATAEASFSASYGYDVRGEVFGDGGMATAGSTRMSDMDYYGPAGVSHDTARADTELLHGAYVAEFVAFVDAIRSGADASAIPTGEDGVRSLEIARAAIISVSESHTVSLEEVAR
mgnify:CR=1 FL=1